MASLDWSQCSAVESIPGKVSGAWVFKGTRTPVAVVFENLEDGMTVDVVVEQFPVNPTAGEGCPEVRRLWPRRARAWALMRVLFGNSIAKGQELYWMHDVRRGASRPQRPRHSRRYSGFCRDPSARQIAV